MGDATRLGPKELARLLPAEGTAPPDYELLRILGRGGCAVVYEARHPKHGVVALKLTDPGTRLAGSGDGRLAREAALLSRVRHPNVLRIFDAGRTKEGAPYLVMEFLHGEDVESILARKRVLGTSVACEIVRQVLAALEAVHAAGIVHRDLKPNNVMIDEPLDGSPAIVKLIDFGIARSANVERLTATGSVVGTPQYLAPEQVRGADFDERVDVWAAGILLFELLTGRTPFDGLGLEETFGATLYGELPDVRSVRFDVPASIAKVVARALERSPDARHASAREMRHALEAAIASERLAASSRALGAQLAVRKRTLPFGFVAIDEAARRELERVVPVLREDAFLSSIPTARADATRSTGSRLAALRDRSAPLLFASLAIAIFSLGFARFESTERISSGRDEKHPPIAEPIASRTAAVPTSPHEVGAIVEAAGNTERVDPARRDTSHAARRRMTHVASPSAHAAPTAERLAARARRAHDAGDLEKANQLYAQATTLAPAYAPAWRGVALTAYELGQGGTARRAMRRYRSLIGQ